MAIVTGQDIRRQPLSVKLAAVKERIDRILSEMASCRIEIKRLKSSHYYTAAQREQEELERLGLLLQETNQVLTDLTTSSVNQTVYH